MSLWLFIQEPLATPSDQQRKFKLRHYLESSSLALGSVWE